MLATRRKRSASGGSLSASARPPRGWRRWGARTAPIARRSAPEQPQQPRHHARAGHERAQGLDDRLRLLAHRELRRVGQKGRRVRAADRAVERKGQRRKVAVGADGVAAPEQVAEQHPGHVRVERRVAQVACEALPPHEQRAQGARALVVRLPPRALLHVVRVVLLAVPLEDAPPRKPALQGPFALVQRLLVVGGHGRERRARHDGESGPAPARSAPPARASPTAAARASGRRGVGGVGGVGGGAAALTAVAPPDGVTEWRDGGGRRAGFLIGF